MPSIVTVIKVSDLESISEYSGKDLVHLFVHFACGYSVVPASFVENSPFLSNCFSQKLIGHKYRDLFLDSQICSIDLYVYPCVNTSLLLLL